MRTKLFTLSLILFFALQQFVNAQTITQTVKGTVTDGETGLPLNGATISVGETGNGLAAISDTAGSFSIPGIPVGRQTVLVSYIGYETQELAEMVTSAKEVVLDIRLRSSGGAMEGVTIRSGFQKSMPKNKMALVSARAFTVEETRRYAGGLDDPARLVSAFSGVTTGNVSDNAIIVRGNSPKSVSWRLEGIEIPTPHHFEGGNFAGGGIVTLFSSQLLANSDFFTGAFPAEYNNALAGVFDMSFRNGNADRHEHALQVGVLGIDVSSEGPFSGKNGASYLFNYRYSTLGLLSDMKMIQTDQLFKYQDLSFKLNFPTKKAGTFSLWGIGGIDNGSEPLVKDSTTWETDWDRVGFNWDTYKGALGLTHKKMLGTATTLQSTIAGVGKYNKMEMKQLDYRYQVHPEMLLDDKTSTFSLNSFVNHRFNSNAVLKAGFELKQQRYDLFINSAIDYKPETYRNFADDAGKARQYAVYVQSKINISPALALSGGVQMNHFSVNKSTSVEPRLALSGKISPDHSVSLGYGLHTQPEELKFYMVRFEENGRTTYPNKNLKLTKAHHFVLAYDWQINNTLRLKIEPYFQYLYDALGTITGTYSMLNYKQEWYFKDKFANNVTGKNMGIDVTLERFLSNNYYYLITGSIFDSKYKTHDNIWRNTRYNKNYVANILGGKEFFFKDNRRVLGINGRFNVIGGQRYSPVNETESLQKMWVVYDESKAFEEQLPVSIYGDVSITYRVNRKKYSGIIALQVKNLFGSPTYEGFDYNYKSKSIQRTESKAIVPSISYKIEF